MRTDRPNPGTDTVILAGAGLVLSGLVFGVLEVGAWLSTGQWATLTEIGGVFTGSQPWTGWHTLTAAGLVVLLAALAVPVVLLVRRMRAAAKLPSCAMFE